MNRWKKRGLFSIPSEWTGNLLAYGLVVLWFWWNYLVFAGSTLEPYRASIKNVLRQVPQPFDALGWMLVGTTVTLAPVLTLFFCVLHLTRRRHRNTTAARNAAREKESQDYTKMLTEMLAEVRSDPNLTEKDRSDIQKSVEDALAEHRNIEVRMASYRENSPALEEEMRQQKAKYEASLQIRKLGK